MKKGTKGGKIGTAARQVYQGLTLGAGDKLIDYPTAAIVAALTDQPVSEVLKQARSMSKEDLARDAENAPGLSVASNVVGGVLPSMIAGPTKLAQTGLGALTGLASSNGDLKEAGLGAAFGLGGSYLSDAVSGLGRGLSDKITPEAKKVAAKLKSLGIKPRITQLIDDNPLLNSIDAGLSYIPLSGAAKSARDQKRTFTREVSKTFGEDADVLDAELLGRVKKRLGDEYQKIVGGKVFNIDRGNFAQGLGQKIDDFALASGNRPWANELQGSILRTLDDNIDQAGGLTGESYQTLRRTLKDASGTNAKARDILKFLDDSVRNVSTDDVAEQLGKNDELYRNLQITRKAFDQGQNARGTLKPDALYNVAKQSIPNLGFGGGGSMGDLASAGRFLRPTVNDSGTVSRALGATGLAGVGYGGLAANPAIAGGAALSMGSGNLTNRLMQSDYLQNGMGPIGQEVMTQAGKVIPSLLRSGQMQGNAEAPFTPQETEDFSDIEAILGQPQEDFSDIEAILAPQMPEQTTALPAMNAPMRVPEGQQTNGVRPRVQGDIDKLLGQYSPEELLLVARPQMASNMTYEDGSPLWNEQEIQYLEGLKGQKAGGSNLLGRIKQAESGGNPNAKNPNSSASGLYQFTDQTWRGMVNNYPETGLTMADKNRPDAQQIMAELLTKENTNAYQKAGIQPNDADLYLAHFLGAPSAVKAKQSMGKNILADALLPKAAKANQSIFYNNGRPRTIDEVYSVLGSKVGA